MSEPVPYPNRRTGLRLNPGSRVLSDQFSDEVAERETAAVNKVEVKYASNPRYAGPAEPAALAEYQRERSREAAEAAWGASMADDPDLRPRGNVRGADPLFTGRGRRYGVS